ncbi:TIM-barrel domain-containing protein [Psychroserpens jangbogonensis]|uniref:TIM-barrel domain-containing protein n=1 Tax=Psychroserpens jangbogonensis TaxID=1484460 RepID=UPI0009E0428D|nr:TIM-barrel domain-containing protein [Psychroserpens jangbogonensis]
MKVFTFILSFLFGFNLMAQVTIVVDELPDETPKDASIYISGSFEDWTGGQDQYKLEQKDGTYQITFPISENLLFKFTQGTWQSAECNNNGEAIDNRNYVFDKANDTLHVKIAGWSNSFDIEKASTASNNVSFISENFEMPELNRNRRIWLYLPPDYHSSNKSYPVVYMHDGQNLFDNKTSYSGEWRADETMNRLFRDKNLKLIIVGIDNGGDKRLDEYSPWINDKYGGGEGKAYVEFITNTLKPYIDHNYNTLTDKANTAIVGSSMGGLISHYAALEYPNVFGKGAVFSPSFWFAPDEVFKFSKDNAKNSDSKLYFLAGGQEGINAGFEEINNTENDLNLMVSLLKSEGFTAKNIQSKVVPEGEHNEKFWKEEFEEAILWLFPDAVNKRQFVSAKQNNAQLEVQVSDGSYTIQFYSKDIVETTFIPTGETVLNTSHAVILSPSKIETSFKDNTEGLHFSSEGISVSVQKQPFKISYEYNGKPIISERNGYQKNDEFETIQFNLTKDETLYGGGARALGMNRRGNRLRLYNRAHYGYETESKLMNFTMPIVMSSNKYMLHFDNAPIGFLDLDSRGDNTVTYETISGRKTYQIIVGDTWYDIIDNYTDLTGKQSMLPRWAMGNFSSRFGYHSQEEVEMTIAKFKEEEIPVDAIILDLYWFGKELKGTMGNLEVFRDSFPDFEGMVKRLNDKGVKTITITEPFILTTSKKWDEAVEKDVLAKDSIGNPARYDFYFGNTGIVDIYKPEAEQWFWNIYKDLANMGVAGIWGDLGEPEVHPNWVQHHTGSADEVHNIYGHDWARLIHEGYKRDFPDIRPFILMRAGYSGSQRYGMVPWSGDVNRTWGGLQSQPEIALQMGMQGLGYMHSDLGGFAGANLDDELYVRWLQYGVFQPIFRPHAQEEVASEPVFRSDKAKGLAKQAIELRYKLLPYNYNLVYENNRFGKPLMRPLFFEDPNNEDLFNYSKTYLWGNNILVSPVLEAGKTEQEMYFPKDNVWFDFYTGQKITGGQTKTVQLNESSIPTYVRAGSFIPMAKPMQSTSEYTDDDLEVHYYFDKSAPDNEEEFYTDEGNVTDAIQKQAYEILEFESILKGINLQFEFEFEHEFKQRIGDIITIVSGEKSIDLVVHNIQKEPKYIKVNGKRVTTNWDSKSKKAVVSFVVKPSKKTKIKIKLKR